MESKLNTNFEDTVKQKLENFELPVDNTVWEGVQAGLKKQQKRALVIPVAWFSSGIAATIALVVFLNLHKHEQNFTVNKAYPSKTAVKPAKVFSANETASEIKNVNNSTNLKQLKQQTYCKIQSSKTICTDKFTLDTLKTFPAQELVKEVPIQNKEQKQVDIALNQTNDSIIKDTKSNNLIATVDWDDPLPKNKSKKFELLALIGGGNGVSTQNTLQMSPEPVMMRSKVVDVPSENKSLYAANDLSILSPNDFSDIQYFTPISISIGMALPLTNKLFVESGLVYTNLHTRFKDGTKDASLTLHYLGVPVRLSYNYFSTKKINLYLAGGTTIEKGLWSDYNQRIDYQSLYIDTNADQKITGFQWSINGSAGISYQAFNIAAIYLEPRLSYYFDSNQPMSIRTKSPLNIGIEGGFRFIINKK